MPGKYADVIKDLPSLTGNRSERVNIVREKFADLGAIDLARQYALFRKKKAALDTELKLVQENVDAVASLLVPAYESAGVSSMKILETGQTVSVQKEPSAVLENKDAFRLWCIANGYERELRLMPQTMNALVKEKILAGEAPPEGTSVYVRDKLVLKKG